jgi:hypothetical protein
MIETKSKRTFDFKFDAEAQYDSAYFEQTRS